MRTVRPRLVFEFSKVPVYDSLHVRISSENPVSVPELFELAKKESGRPQSVGHALVTRVALHDKNEKDGLGTDASELYQKTGTISLSYLADGSWVTGFVDLEGNEEDCNLVQAGYNANQRYEELIIAVKDRSICDLIQHAQNTNRVAQALTQNPTTLGTIKKNGKSAYGQYPYAKALFGSSKLAELNASYLHKNKNCEAKIYGPTAEDIARTLKGKEDSALVRAVGLGGDGFVGVYGVYADGDFYDGGWARSVVHVGAQNSPSEKKVRKVRA